MIWVLSLFILSFIIFSYMLCFFPPSFGQFCLSEIVHLF